jgi:urea transport system permease protein
MLKKLLLSSCAVLFAVQAHALAPEQAQAIVIGDSSDRIAAMQQAVQTPDERVAALLQALAEDMVKVHEGKVILVHEVEGEWKGEDPVTGQPVAVPEDAEDVVNNNRMRGEIANALAALKLFGPDANARLAAAKALATEPDESRLPLIDKALAAERDEAVREQLDLARAAILLSSAEPAQRLAAVQVLAAYRTPATRQLLGQQLPNEADAQVKAAIQTAQRAIEEHLAWGERAGVLFTGVSLGSILLLAALGLAITYGLMGVINMAHGELIMIGAYATYMVQGLFRSYLPDAFDWYLVAAVPMAFLASALVGAALERGVIRFLYGRPLETLLATWGISLVLMQAVRSLFGAQNVAVENPAWMSGGWQVLSNLTLPYNRLVIIAFAFAVLLGMALLISRTRLGLFVRGVTQNRPIASCMGVNTARVDTYAFALGSGVAGLAGCALSQVGNVGPDLGQGYIVDSFMVVVLGGVGQLAGTVYAALGLGLVNKLLEGWQGAVLAKIMVLVFIIAFIQKRPQGIFALKGRSVD